MTTAEPRTAAATKARMRASEEKHAERLRDRGWICLAPGTSDFNVAQYALCGCGGGSAEHGAK